jgi:Rrf2 family protein
MRVPMRVDYGVRALVELALHEGARPMQTPEIASRQNIPEAYLDQVMTTLHKEGLTHSRRGPRGGHTLAVEPKKIDLGMIMAALEGKSRLLDCLMEPQGCELSNACAQREVWRDFEESVQELLGATTIAHMAERQRELTVALSKH